MTTTLLTEKLHICRHVDNIALCGQNLNAQPEAQTMHALIATCVECLGEELRKSRSLALALADRIADQLKAQNEERDRIKAELFGSPDD